MGKKINIAIFASGAGSNAKAIIEHFQTNREVSIELIVCNKPDAGVLKIAKDHQISTLLIEKEQFFSQKSYLEALNEAKIDFIVLAGFLWKIPEVLIQAFPGKIINIHPALLPKYGGKGMYGQKVHAAVIANHEKESGITIHYVDEQYDHGSTIFQASCVVLENDTPEILAERIHQLEYQYYPKIVEELILKLIQH
ncbi:MAG: phosphoribosylglycinamide formyltransferase [Bacteroidetes bacterium]|nr:phosphoribosylglycinamide formyltransferase [Bacteroidota bacterium]